MIVLLPLVRFGVVLHATTRSSTKNSGRLGGAPLATLGALNGGREVPFGMLNSLKHRAVAGGIVRVGVRVREAFCML